jgi:hypothetical protein
LHERIRFSAILAQEFLIIGQFLNVPQRHAPLEAPQTRGHNSIGVVLSGTGSDGAMGIQEIKGGGGITFAQEPNSARFGGMPKKAIETECVDFVLTAEGIAEKIFGTDLSEIAIGQARAAMTIGAVPMMAHLQIADLIDDQQPVGIDRTMHRLAVTVLTLGRPQHQHQIGRAEEPSLVSSE